MKYGRDRGRRIAPPSAARRHSACFAEPSLARAVARPAAADDATGGASGLAPLVEHVELRRQPDHREAEACAGGEDSDRLRVESFHHLLNAVVARADAH